ncbi:MAG: DUF4387 domain-containing protein [Chloroflexi bacterium]|nr:DUF4387 domain-containing protein [Chloroflexota bacterium]
MAKLRNLAGVIRSKNSGAFEITFDIMFKDEATFRRVQQTGVINPMLFARLYQVPEAQCNFVEYPRGLAFKCTIPRPIPSGDLGDSDVYGAQQHAPLLDVEVPLEA